MAQRKVNVDPHTDQTCPACGQPRQCDIAEGQSHCWCFELPPVSEDRDSSATPVLDKVDPEDRCLCKSCLRKKLAATARVQN